MAFDQQQSSEKSVRVTVHFPELPPVNQRADLERWYFNLRTALQDALHSLADEIDRLKAKD